MATQWEASRLPVIPSHAYELGDCIPFLHLCQHLQQGCQDYDASKYQHCLPENGRDDYYKNDKAYCMHMNTICSISDPAHCENWMSHQRIGAIAQDSANINSGNEHDYVTNTLKGGDESHNVAILLRMF